jgi:hypothetical protein
VLTPAFGAVGAPEGFGGDTPANVGAEQGSAGRVRAPAPTWSVMKCSRRRAAALNGSNIELRFR